MKVINIPYLLFIVLLGVLCSCRQQADTSNRSYFTFDLEDRKVVIPVQLNDSVTVKLVFDSGDNFGYNFEFVTLDSSILLVNPSLPRNHILGTQPWRIAWSPITYPATFYDSMQLKLNLGRTDFVYSVICAWLYKKYMNSTVADGMFNIPKSDTTHVWELNFENNYMEVHTADNYQFPEDCMLLPLEASDYNPFFVTLPLKVRFSDGDTLTIHRKFFIDTGYARDIVLLLGAQEQDYLHQREDAVWLQDLDRYIRYYTVTGTLFDDLQLDSLRLYTLDYKNSVAHPYLIGLNFLKRFNVFFDMKNKRLGLQPIDNFQRLVNPLYCRFHYSTEKNKDGRFFVNCVGDYKENYYKTAGLQVGDEIVAIAGIPYDEITLEMGNQVRRLSVLDVDIVRDGKLQTLYVKVDHNEPTGD